MPAQLVRRRGVILLSGLLAAGPAAFADGPRDLMRGLIACREIVAAAPRLACYDALSPAIPAISFEGTGNVLTPAFDIAAPSRLFFESRDAVLVIYLLDAGSGAVVQNLHRGGAGEGDFLIEAPGRYAIQINATGGWRIRIGAP